MIEIIVVAEAHSDQEMACGLADRVFLESPPEWWDAEAGFASESLAAARRWRGLENDRTFIPWSSIKHLFSTAQRNGTQPRYLGHARKESPGFDYASGRKAILLCVTSPETKSIRHFLFVRDIDNQEKRRPSLEDLREDHTGHGIQLTLALPFPNREAWLISGFSPQTNAERDCHMSVRSELGFDPCQNPHRLSADASNAPKSAKRVLWRLMNGSGPNPERERSCWAEPALSDLRASGVHTGLSQFLDEVREDLSPIILAEV